MANKKQLIRKSPYSLTYKDVTELLRLLENADSYEQIDLTYGDLKISLRRQKSARHAESKTQSNIAAEALAAEAPASSKTPLERPKSSHSFEPAAGTSTSNKSQELTAPMLGTFYRSPEPGAPPYAKEGDHVQGGDTIGVIEVMKLFTPVTTDVPGVVMEFLAENASLVEYGQPLVRIAPD